MLSIQLFVVVVCVVLQGFIRLQHAAHKTAQLLGAESGTGRFDHKLDPFGDMQVAAHLKRTWSVGDRPKLTHLLQ